MELFSRGQELASRVVRAAAAGARAPSLDVSASGYAPLARSDRGAAYHGRCELPVRRGCSVLPRASAMKRLREIALRFGRIALHVQSDALTFLSWWIDELREVGMALFGHFAPKLAR